MLRRRRGLLRLCVFAAKHFFFENFRKIWKSGQKCPFLMIQMTDINSIVKVVKRIVDLLKEDIFKIKRNKQLRVNWFGFQNCVDNRSVPIVMAFLTPNSKQTRPSRPKHLPTLPLRRTNRNPPPHPPLPSRSHHRPQRLPRETNQRIHRS